MDALLSPVLYICCNISAISSALRLSVQVHMNGLPTSVAMKEKPLASYSSPSVEEDDVALRTPAVSSKTTSTLCSFQVRETCQQRTLHHGLHWRYSSPPGTQSQVTLYSPCCSQCLDSPPLHCQSNIDRVPSELQLKMDRI